MAEKVRTIRVSTWPSSLSASDIGFPSASASELPVQDVAARRLALAAREDWPVVHAVGSALAEPLLAAGERLEHLRWAELRAYAYSRVADWLNALDLARRVAETSIDVPVDESDPRARANETMAEHYSRQLDGARMLAALNRAGAQTVGADYARLAVRASKLLADLEMFDAVEPWCAEGLERVVEERDQSSQSILRTRILSRRAQAQVRRGERDALSHLKEALQRCVGPEDAWVREELAGGLLDDGDAAAAAEVLAGAGAAVEPTLSRVALDARLRARQGEVVDACRNLVLALAERLSSVPTLPLEQRRLKVFLTDVAELHRQVEGDDPYISSLAEQCAAALAAIVLVRDCGLEDPKRLRAWTAAQQAIDDLRRVAVRLARGRLTTRTHLVDLGQRRLQRRSPMGAPTELSQLELVVLRHLANERDRPAKGDGGYVSAAELTEVINQAARKTPSLIKELPSSDALRGTVIDKMRQRHGFSREELIVARRSGPHGGYRLDDES